MFQRAPGGEVVDAEETDVYVVNADGSEEQLLAAGAGPGRWSPDGSEVSIFCCDDGVAAHFSTSSPARSDGSSKPDPTWIRTAAFGVVSRWRAPVLRGLRLDDPSRNGIYTVGPATAVT